MTLNLAYDFRPLPFASPEYLVFRPGEQRKALDIACLGDQSFTITDIHSSDNRVSWTTNDANGGSDGLLSIELEYDFDNLAVPEEDVIVLDTNCVRRPSIRVPYLALKN